MVMVRFSVVVAIFFWAGTGLVCGPQVCLGLTFFNSYCVVNEGSSR